MGNPNFSHRNLVPQFMLEKVGISHIFEQKFNCQQKFSKKDNHLILSLATAQDIGEHISNVIGTSRVCRGRPALLESHSCEFRDDRGHKQTIWSEKWAKNGQKKRHNFFQTSK